MRGPPCRLIQGLGPGAPSLFVFTCGRGASGKAIAELRGGEFATPDAVLWRSAHFWPGTMVWRCQAAQPILSAGGP